MISTCNQRKPRGGLTKGSKQQEGDLSLGSRERKDSQRWCGAAELSVWGKPPDRKLTDEGDDRGSSERARERQGKSTTHMLAGTGAVVAGKGSKGLCLDVVARLPTRDCDDMRVRRKSNTTKIQRSYDGSSGRRMKWLEMFDWKGNCEVTWDY